jgi:hypothetical protein
VQRAGTVDHGPSHAALKRGRQRGWVTCRGRQSDAQAVWWLSYWPLVLKSGYVVCNASNPGCQGRPSALDPGPSVWVPGAGPRTQCDDRWVQSAAERRLRGVVFSGLYSGSVLRTRVQWQVPVPVGSYRARGKRAVVGCSASAPGLAASPQEG